ncbi:D-Ala-D-Ala carboxypeptidase family metallohydrolase [Nannocystis pusilla]|uniref:D-Ala-D-Ala carboxypeptidase family metallohydrolase n=1 Tax=Nannocystis pusilla TaxID=889268 RepID=UPI003B7C180D
MSGSGDTGLTAPRFTWDLLNPNTSGQPGSFTGRAVSPEPIQGQTNRFSKQMENAGTAADQQLGDKPAGGECATCPPRIRLEHRSQYTAKTRYSEKEWVVADKFIFLVGKDASTKFRTLSVRVAEPAGASATWEVKPIGDHSGKIAKPTGTGNRFDYTPEVTNAQRPITASRKPNPPVQYSIKATITHEGKSHEITEIVTQDERDIIRQEYVDQRMWRTGFTLHVPYRTRIKETARADLRGNYQLILDSAMTELLTATEAAYGASVFVSSGWRNPRRNLAAGSEVPNSNHQHGGALDMQPVGQKQMTGATRRSAYLRLYNAARSVRSRVVLLEKGPKAVYPSSAAVPEPTPKTPDNNEDGIPDAATSGGSKVESLFDIASHVHIDRAAPDEADDD